MYVCMCVCVCSRLGRVVTGGWASSSNRRWSEHTHTHTYTTWHLGDRWSGRPHQSVSLYHGTSNSSRGWTARRSSARGHLLLLQLLLSLHELHYFNSPMYIYDHNVLSYSLPIATVWQMYFSAQFSTHFVAVVALRSARLCFAIFDAFSRGWAIFTSLKIHFFLYSLEMTS